MSSESIVDEKGRVCIPAELRKKLRLKAGEKVIFQMDTENILIIRKSLTSEEFLEESEKFMELLGKTTNKPIKFEKIIG